MMTALKSLRAARDASAGGCRDVSHWDLDCVALGNIRKHATNYVYLKHPKKHDELSKMPTSALPRSSSAAGTRRWSAREPQH